MMESDTDKIKRLVGFPRTLRGLIDECIDFINKRSSDSVIESCLAKIKEKATRESGVADHSYDQIAEFLMAQDKSLSMLYVILPSYENEQDPFISNPYCKICDPDNHSTFQIYFVKRRVDFKDKRIYCTKLTGLEIERLYKYIDKKTKENIEDGLVVSKNLKAMRIIKDKIFCDLKGQIIEVVLSKVFGESNYGLLEVGCDVCKETVFVGSSPRY